MRWIVHWVELSFFKQNRKISVLEGENEKTPAVSTTYVVYGWLELNFASCVIRQTHSLIGRACAMFRLQYLYKYGACELPGTSINDMLVDTQFHKFHGRPFARVLHVFLMKDIIG